MQKVSQSGIGGRQTIGWQIYFIRQRRRRWKVVHTAPSNAISENFWKCQIAPRGDRQWQLRWWFRLGRSLIFHRKQLKAEIIRKTIRAGIAVWWWSQSNRQIGVKKDKQQNAWAIFVNDFLRVALTSQELSKSFWQFLKHADRCQKGQTANYVMTHHWWAIVVILTRVDFESMDLSVPL